MSSREESKGHLSETEGHIARRRAPTDSFFHRQVWMKSRSCGGRARRRNACHTSLGCRLSARRWVASAAEIGVNCSPWSMAMRQRKLGLHTPPCHRRMVITTLFSVLLAALQRRPVLYHTRWLLAVHWPLVHGEGGGVTPCTE